MNWQFAVVALNEKGLVDLILAYFHFTTIHGSTSGIIYTKIFSLIPEQTRFWDLELFVYKEVSSLPN